MELSKNLHENIGVSEFIRAETELSAVIYRQEFDRHRQEYLRTKLESEVIFIFIFLQIYIECFLHQNMRKVVELEFKPPRDGVYTKWLLGERHYIPAKIDDFADLFFSPVPIEIQKWVDCIKDGFDKVSDIRNRFVHGHKIAAWSGSNGNSGITPARSLLTESQLGQTISEINELGSAWNKLLENVLQQCKTLRHIDDFKFLNI